MKLRTFVVAALALAGATFAGGAAAQEMSLKQRILMPGKVIEGHADFESDCDACHKSFDKEGLTQLCLDCHDEIRSDRESGQGFHGQDPLSSQKSCNTCHTDHLGRDADIINMQVDTFNHDYTRFPLVGQHQPLECASCHEPDEKYREAEPQCATCHKEDDFHRGALGEDCASCHTPASWQQRETFDHSLTDFALEGLHKEAACIGCHAGQRYEFEETTCVSCHSAADVHSGQNGAQCDTCHAVSGWDNIIYDHSATDFPLRNSHAELPCLACHANGVVAELSPVGSATAGQTGKACYDCHATDDVHLGRNGKQCDSCHSTEGWAQPKFDHQAETGFALTGNHQELACTNCHSGALTQALPRDCAGCHAADDPHKVPEMQYCATCHVTEGWGTIARFDHDFTAFPLVGLHQIAACESCHIGGDFTNAASACVDCHKEDDHHQGALGQQCDSCHSPNAWNIWQFDHERQAGYKLEGSHEDLACASCHLPGTDPADTSTSCGSCHRQDDIHRGAFGANCGRCHSQNRFFELKLQD